ncbi:MAG TPA: hypothetical protein VEA99_03550, partial [Gemmatimonadaceae bacterium]|nr:hypothetical protein [Gemmatimonadaceae bacterium]
MYDEVSTSHVTNHVQFEHRVRAMPRAGGRNHEMMAKIVVAFAALTLAPAGLVLGPDPMRVA